VARVRRAYGLKRVGHGGTLDPAVTGVLPVALGPATRLLPYLPGEKAYRAWIQLGVRTTTDDLDGTVLDHQPPPANLTAQTLNMALAPFRGSIQQRPPSFSAVHVQGQRAYALARAGHQLHLPPRPVTLHRLEILAWDRDEGRLELDIHCSSGTYIRLHQSVALDALVPPLPPLLDPLDVLHHLPRHQLTSREEVGWRHGREMAAHQPWPPDATVLVVAPDGKLAGLAKPRGQGELRPHMVFNTDG